MYVRPRTRSQRPRAGRPGPSPSPSRPERLPAAVPEESIQRHAFTPQWILSGAAVNIETKPLWAPTTPSLYTRMLISLWAARSKMSLAATLQVILSVSKNTSLWRRCPALFTPAARGQKQLEGAGGQRTPLQNVPAATFVTLRLHCGSNGQKDFPIHNLPKQQKYFLCWLDEKKAKGEMRAFCYLLQGSELHCASSRRCV